MRMSQHELEALKIHQIKKIVDIVFRQLKSAESANHVSETCVGLVNRKTVYLVLIVLASRLKKKSYIYLYHPQN